MSASQVNPLTAYVTSAAAGDSSGVDSALLNAVNPSQDNALVEQTENLALPYGEQIFAPIYNNNDIPAGESTAITDPYAELVGPGVYIDPALYANPYAASLGVPTATATDWTPLIILAAVALLFSRGSTTSANRTRGHK